MTTQLYNFSTKLSTCLIKELVLLVLLVTNILPQSRCLASSSNSNKFGVLVVRSPESTIAPQGDEVQFECELNLVPERLEWRFLPHDRLGDNQNDYTFMNINTGHNVTLNERISKLAVVVSQSTIGEYRCIAWFGSSALASLPAKLMLATISLDSSGDSGKSTPSQLRRGYEQDMVSWTVSPGNSVIIKCGDVISFPPPVWSFYKDTVAVPSSLPQLPNGALILSSVTQRDSGTYSCSAINSITNFDLRLPQRTTLAVDFQPRSAPTFLSYVQKNFSAKPGTSIILECPGVGNPVPKAVWSRPDALVQSNRTVVLPYGLRINNVMQEDQGMYTCRLDNGISPALIHKVQLTVLQSPIIVDPPRETLTNESDSLELDCSAVGSPEPEIYWMINGNETRWDPLIRAHGKKLIIKSVEKRHAGVVQCFARNDAGEDSSSNLLQVSPKRIPGEPGATPLGTFPPTSRVINERPKTHHGKKHKRPIMVPPSRPNVTRLNDESVMVRWTVPPNDGLPIQFFKVQYRVLADPARSVQRSAWSTCNEDIPPHVLSYEVSGLKPERSYRFRIAAVYSNNDNQLGHTSEKFLLQRGVQRHLPVPKLTRIEPLSETTILLHWEFPGHAHIEGFYAYYRPASTAGEYSKATVDGSSARRFKIDHLESGTAYEFKLQSFTQSAASDFSQILTGKTLKPVTPPPFTPSVIGMNDASKQAQMDFMQFLPIVIGGCVILLIVLIIICFAFKRRSSSRADDTENKTHPDAIQPDSNGYSRNHNHKINGAPPCVNVITNPMDQDGDKNRNIMELRFMPNAGVLGIPTNNASPPPPVLPMKPSNEILPPLPQRRTLDRSLRNLNNGHIIHQNGINAPSNDNMKNMADGDCGLTQVRTSSMRRHKARNHGSVPGSPRIIRGPSTELLQNNKYAASPVPIRAHGVKRSQQSRLGRADNLSSGSLNSIEV